MVQPVRPCLGLALILSVSSCSFAFVRGPPARTAADSTDECTSSFLVPALDVAFLGLALAATAAESTDGIEKGDVAAGAPWLVSALYGVIQVTRCRAAGSEAGGPAVDEGSRPVRVE